VCIYIYIQCVSEGIVNILGGGIMDYSIYIQDVSGGIVNILGGGSMDYSIYIYRMFQEE
jgi:hypothetical protein